MPIKANAVDGMGHDRPGMEEHMSPEFDTYAEEYQKLLADPLRDGFGEARFFHERKLSLLREFVRRRGWEPKRATWVDIGCGRGDLLKLGQAGFGVALGCDVSPAMLGACDGLQVQRQEQDDVLPFADRFADLATAVCVYHHIPPSKRAGFTREAARILKPGGCLCIIEHNPTNPITRMIVRRSPVDVDAQLLGVTDTCRLLEGQNLRIEAVQHFLFFPEFLFRKLGFVEAWLTWLPLGGQYAVFARVP
jgi:SAM-dependent methyltransferase